jgi:hypothetical protein
MKMNFLHKKDFLLIKMKFFFSFVQQGEILVLESTTMYLSCQLNPCKREGEALWRDGKCYKIGKTSATFPSVRSYLPVVFHSFT